MRTFSLGLFPWREWLKEAVLCRDPQPQQPPRNRTDDDLRALRSSARYAVGVEAVESWLAEATDLPAGLSVDGLKYHFSEARPNHRLPGDSVFRSIEWAGGGRYRLAGRRGQSAQD
jgi:hypothetical protein